VHNGIDRRQRQRRAAFQIGIDWRCAQFAQFAVRRFGAREGEDLVAVRDEPRDQTATDQAGASRDEDFHPGLPFGSDFRITRMALSRICSRTADFGGGVLRIRAVE
jgi:hypothetical protein